MAQVNGYVSVPHNSYEVWKLNTLGNGYNVDFSYGNQCWDLCSLCYYQYGDTLYTGPQARAKECWTVSKNRNQQPPFYAVEGKENIKKGDIIVLDGTSSHPTGHICFADEDYNGTNSLRTFGQTPSLHGINGNASVDVLDISLFLGIFRNSDWYTPPTPPAPTEEKKRKFPWAIAWNHWDGFKH